MMRNCVALFFFGFICSLSCTQSTQTKNKGNLLCYFPNWAMYWNGEGKFDGSHIDPFLCTHILYAFADMDESGAYKVYDEWADISCGLYANVTGYKRINPDLKVLISVGGWTGGSEKYSLMAKDPVRRATFINTTIAAMKQYGFDGLDLDWEYPGRRGGDEQLDKENYITLLKELREAFNEHNYLLTAAVAPASPYVDISYDIPAMSKYLDFINLMEYDYHGLWDGYTGYNAPLFPSPADPTANKKDWNINASVKKWIAEGADPQKLIMGIPLYGRTYTLNNTTNMNVGVETWTPGPQSRYITESGIYGYNEICEKIIEENWTIVWDKFSLVPYMYKDRVWVSYDDVESIKMKVRYGMNKKLGGFMAWSLATDDFLGNCGKKNILIHAIREIMGF